MLGALGSELPRQLRISVQLGMDPSEGYSSSGFLIGYRLLVGVGVMKSLVPEAFYWARSGKHGDGMTTIVQVSTVFGSDPDYWTLVVPGSEQHHMVSDFEIIALVEPLDGYPLRHAAE
jgi:hypothetical protein